MSVLGPKCYFAYDSFFVVNVLICVFKLLTPLGIGHLYKKIIVDGAMCVICLQDKQMIINAGQLKTDTFRCNTKQYNL